MKFDRRMYLNKYNIVLLVNLLTQIVFLNSYTKYNFYLLCNNNKMQNNETHRTK